MRHCAQVALVMLALSLARPVLAQDAAAESAIRRLVADQARAWDAGDAAAYARDVAADVSFTNLFGMVMYGAPAFVSRHRDILTSFYKGTTKRHVVRRIRFVTPDVAIVDIDNEVHGVKAMPSGIAVPPDGIVKTQLMEVLVRRDGRWWVEAYHNVDVKAGAQPVPPAGQTPAPSVEIAFVANAQAATVALVDVAGRSIVGTIDVNPARVKSTGPGAPNYAQDTDVSPDGRTLYVSRGYMGDVAAFDLASGRPLWQRTLNTGRADHMTLTPDGRTLFVSAFMDNRVYRIATATGEITGHLVTGVSPHDNKVSHDGRWIYNSSIGPLASLPRSPDSPPLTETPGYPFQLTIADAGTLKIRDRIRLDNALRPWQFAPGEKTLYAQLSNEHAVVAYDIAARKVIRRLDLPVKPGVTATDWDFEAPHHGLALTDDGQTLCLAGRASDYAALVRTADMTLIATVPVGDAPGWAETADSGKVCLVANSRSDDLSIISIANRSEIVRLPIGDGPKHVTVARIPASVIARFRARQ